MHVDVSCMCVCAWGVRVRRQWFESVADTNFKERYIMAYKFNGGRGAVVCDNCGIIFDANIGYMDYIDIYEKEGESGVFCWRCKTGYKQPKGEHDYKCKEGGRNCNCPKVCT